MGQVRGRRAPLEARAGIERAAADGRGVLIPTISLWEIARLSYEGRLKLGDRPERWFDAALTPTIALMAAGLGTHADPADRLIMATAIVHGAALVTRDQAILEFASSGQSLRVLEA